jgi:hypothetical protein
MDWDCHNDPDRYLSTHESISVETLNEFLDSDESHDTPLSDAYTHAYSFLPLEENDSNGALEAMDNLMNEVIKWTLERIRKND